jgi:hypothetical protein
MPRLLTCREFPARAATGCVSLLCLAWTGAAICALRADEPTPAQNDEAEARFERLERLRSQADKHRDRACRCFVEGRDDEAVAEVEQSLAIERAMMPDAGLVARELERIRQEEARERAEPPGVFGGLYQVPSMDAFHGLRAHRRERLERLYPDPPGVLHLLGQLHEARGDYTEASRTYAELVTTVTERTGDTWRTRRLRRDQARLKRLAELPPPRVELGRQARAATAVMSGGMKATWGGSIGCAFCVDPGGLFITRAQNVSGLATEWKTTFEYDSSGRLVGTKTQPNREKPLVIPLELDPGRPGHISLTASILLVDEARDVAVLQAEPNEAKVALPFLNVADDRPPTRGADALAIGYPRIPVRNPVEPQSAILVAWMAPTHIRDVRSTPDGRPWLYLLEDTPPYGTEGGPVLDDRGRVLGLIVCGPAGTDIHYVLPASAIREVLSSARLLARRPAR